jgi:Gas vesicle synthesis protein GvpL/GvpF
MTSQYGLYAYGLVGETPEQLALLGIDKKSKVYVVAGRDIRVVVSKIDIDTFQSQIKQSFSDFTITTAHSGTQALLQAHEDVVDALMQNTTVVPFKFGTILKDEEAALQMLRDDEEKFKQLLIKFTGRAEWGLKVYADTQEFTQHIAQTEPEFKDLEAQREKLSRGAAYLFGRKMEEELKNTVVALLARSTEAIFQELAKDAYEAKLNKTLPQKLTGKKKEMILNTVYLVERAKVARFCRKGKRLRENYASLGLDLEVSGPWPPYSFT